MIDYAAPMLFRASLYMDDGDDPIAGEGDDHTAADLQAVIEWAQDALEAVVLAAPAPAGGRWQAYIERGHFERTGELGIDELDHDWIVDEGLPTVYPSEGRASARPPR